MRKCVILLVVLSMLFSLLFGFSKPYSVKANDNAMNMIYVGPVESLTISVSPNHVIVRPGEVATCSVSTTIVSVAPISNRSRLLSIPSTLNFVSLSFDVSVSPHPSGPYGFEDSNTKFSFYPNGYDAKQTFVFTLTVASIAAKTGAVVQAVTRAYPSASAQFTVDVVSAADNTPPELTVPSDITINRSTFLFIVSATDDSGSIVRMVVKVNGVIQVDKNNLDPTITLFEGSNNVEVIVYDPSGNSASKSFKVISDTKSPVIDLNFPETTTLSTLEFKGRVYDQTTGVKYVRVNDINYPVLQSGNLSGTLILTTGNNAITVEASDNAGNTVTKTYAISYIPLSTFSLMITLEIDNPYITINDISKKIDSQGSKPIIKNSRTLLPIRTLIESVGGTAEWDGVEHKVTIELNGHSIILWIGKDTALVDGSTVKLEVTPEIINGRTYLPLRFIVENLGASVDWDPTTKIITIYYWH